MRALDLLDDGAPDAAHGHAAPLERCGGGANVCLGHASARACSLHRREVDGEIARQAVERQGLERLGADDGDDRLGGLGRLERRHRDRAEQVLPGRADQRERRADRCDLAVLGEDPEHDPADRRPQLDGRLVGLDLDDRLVLDDRVTLAHEPAGDLPLGQPLAELRQRERVCHDRQRNGCRCLALAGAAPESTESTPAARQHGQRVAHGDDLRLVDVADVLAVDLHRHRHVAADQDPVEVVAAQHVTVTGAAAERLDGEPRHGPGSTSTGATMSSPPSNDAPGTNRSPRPPA